ncbi:hypothetical protein BHM03_00004427 [Ensete ventricosum]|nr:hypothetical protein BHM03_00004427 [Ensete ventricosum]
MLSVSLVELVYNFTWFRGPQTLRFVLPYYPNLARALEHQVGDHYANLMTTTLGQPLYARSTASVSLDSGMAG